MNPLLYFWLFLKASLFSTGGMGNLPSLHADLMARRWATERQFAESLMIGQISPGPNGLWVICLGYLTNGLLGALLALIAISLPPLTILWVARLYSRVQHHPAMEGFIRGLSLAVVGIFAVVLVQLMGGVGVDARSVLIALAAAGLGWTRRVPVIVIIGLAAVTGMVWQ
jgi:chromate transporter